MTESLLLHRSASPSAFHLWRTIIHSLGLTSLKMNEVYLPPMSLKEKPDSPVERISPGKQA